MMKKISYIAAAAGIIALSSCSGQEEYDAYVNTLKEQPAAIDTITSAASYAVYLDSLAVKADAFDQIGIKLTPEQKDELSAISLEIQNALTAKYDQLAQQPCDSMAVLDASAPVEPFAAASGEVELR